MKIITLLLLYLSTSILHAQSGAPHPSFSNFVGDAYKMVIVEMEGKSGKKYKTLREEYGEWVYDYPNLGEIDIPELKIPETYISDGKFPGIDRNTQYAMVLHSKMTTSVNACYEFSLNSDDGSILWIDGEKIINNDGGHEMTLKKDSLVYAPGTYEVKVWYFQGLADRFGIVLDAKIIGKPEVCPSDKSIENPTKMVLDNQVFFDSGSYALKPEALSELERISVSIANQKPKVVTVIGHTDSDGTAEANIILSKNRAEVISVALKEQLNLTEVKFFSEGKGESEPIADNTTEKGKAKNRRVDIIIQ